MTRENPFGRQERSERGPDPRGRRRIVRRVRLPLVAGPPAAGGASSRQESGWRQVVRLGPAWRVLALGALLVGLAAVRPAGVRAATDTVGTCNESTLRSVISGATAGDTVTFGCSGTITLTSGGGGAITLSKNLTIDGSGQAVTISGGNSVQVFLVNSGVTATLNDLTIADGRVVGSDGGGIFNGGTLSVTNSTFSDNSAGAFGGGIENAGTLSVTNSTFSVNSAFDGGGIDNIGTLSVTNSTFSGNSAGTDGGGIFNGRTLSVTNSTFSGNSAAVGGGIDSPNPTTLANTILASSTSGGDCAGLGPITDHGGNLADDGTCGSVTQVSTASLKLGSLASNGGPTQTIALGPGSVAIDHTSTNCPSTDQRGSPRPDAGETACDSGAYEFQDAPADTTPPTCVLKSVLANLIVIATQDADGGLAATTSGTFTTAPSPAGGIQLTAVGNASVSIPAVAKGTTTEVDVTALKVTAGVSSHVSLAVTDAAGNVTTCDPVDLAISRATGQPATTTVSGIAHGEGTVHVYNASPGVTTLTLSVNGQTFTLAGMSAQEQRSLDISAALGAGSNTVSLTATGQPGGHATIVIADS